MADDGFSIGVNALDELVRNLRYLERNAADELDEMLEEAVEPVMQAATSRAPGRGRMARRTRLRPRRGARGGVQLVNPHPGANATHWGRKFWPNATHPRRTPSYVVKQPWLYAALVENRDEIAIRVARAIDLWAGRHLT